MPTGQAIFKEIVMGAFYWTYKQNVKPLTNKQLDLIWDGVRMLGKDMPYKFYGSKFQEFKTLNFFTDNGMNYHNGVLGATYFLRPNNVYLAPMIVNTLTWTNNTGIPDNAVAFNTIIHELTHLQQMRIAYGLYYLLLNAPWFSWFTLEEQAVQNGHSAQTRLQTLHDNMRNNT